MAYLRKETTVKYPLLNYLTYRDKRINRISFKSSFVLKVTICSPVRFYICNFHLFKREIKFGIYVDLLHLIYLYQIKDRVNFVRKKDTFH